MSTDRPSKIVLRIEDALIILCLLAFLALALGWSETPPGSDSEVVLWRNTTAGRAGLVVLLAVMLVVFVRRFLRVRRAFKELQD
jgi:hypothetical protein